MQNVIFNGYHLPTLAKLCKELGSPSDGALAEFVWRLSNVDTLPVKIGYEFMAEAGYVPYVGFPLLREASHLRHGGAATNG
jgi:hypothetical protein